MAQKDLNTRLTGDSTSLERALQRGGRAMAQAEREARKLERAQAAANAKMEQAGRGMLVAGAAIGAGLALATRAAIRWESAWTGVAKVLDGSPEQLAALEQELRGLTAVLPQSHEEIAAVAAAAGQLGVATEDVVDFTRVMVDLGTATNLSSEEAAFALARLMNIMGTAPADVSRLGASIVELGNNSATTEADIVEMALRISGAGRTIGLSESQVLAFSAALSSVGIAAEAGGSAISTAFIRIESAVRAGGAELDGFADVAGMSAADFRRAYERDAGAAIDSFVKGLGRIQASGGDVFATLADLGLSEIRLRDALLRLAGAGDLLSRSLATGNRGWEENAALLAEAERRYQTTEARMAIARNQLNDFAIDIGQTFLPVVGGAADMVGSLAETLGDLPAPLKTALGILGAVAAVLLAAGGAALIGVPKIAAYRAAVDALAVSQGRLAAATVAASGAMGRAASVMAGPWGIAIGVALTALAAFAFTAAEARSEMRELQQTLDQQTAAVTEQTRAYLANQVVERLGIENLERYGLTVADVTDAILGDTAALAKWQAAVARSGPVVEGTADTVQDLSGRLAEAQREQEAVAEAMTTTGTAARQADPATRQLAETFGVSAEQAGDLAASIDTLDEELRALFDSLFSVESSADALAEQYGRLSELVDDNGAKLDGNSRAALANRQAVRDLIRTNLDHIHALAEAGASAEELTEATADMRAEFVRQMRQAGFTEDAIDRYAAAFDDVPSKVKTTISTPGLTEAERRIRNLKLAIDHLPTAKHIQLTASVAAPALGRNVAFQHGGWVPGSGPPDSVAALVSPGEFVVRREVAQQNPALMEAINAGGGRIPVGPGGGGAPGGGGVAAAGGGAPPPVQLVIRGDGSTFGRAVVEAFRHETRTNATFRADVRRVAS